MGVDGPSEKVGSLLPKAARWSMINFVDEFGAITGRGTVSPAVRSVRPRAFPYKGTEATLIVDCDIAWIRFSQSPNLSGRAIGNGYTRHAVAVREDGTTQKQYRFASHLTD